MPAVRRTGKAGLESDGERWAASSGVRGCEMQQEDWQPRDIDWTAITPAQAQHLIEVVTGKLLLCHGCYGTFPPATLLVRGTIAGGGPRRFCQECRFCGIYRRKAGSL